MRNQILQNPNRHRFVYLSL